VVGSVLALAAAPGIEPSLLKQALVVLVRMVDAWARPGPPSPYTRPASASAAPASTTVPPGTGAAAAGGARAHGATVAAPGPLSATQLAAIDAAQRSWPGLDLLFMERVLPACFSLPFLGTLKPNDAESTLLVRGARDATWASSAR
jgi:hypothetical protein